MSVVGAFRRYLRSHPRRYAPATIDKRCAIVARYVAAVDVDTAGPLDVENWATGLGLSASSTRDAVSHVRAFYRWRIRTGAATVDPTATVELAPNRRRLPRPARDVAISVAMAGADAPMRAMLALMAGAGLRCVEVARLRWRDVDLVAGSIHVAGKHDRERVMFPSTAVLRALAAVDAATGHVFTSPTTGRPYTPARVSQLVNRHLRIHAAGCTAHQLRHRFATAALEQSGRLDTVRDLLGHASVATTEIYAAVVVDTGDVTRDMPVPGL